MNVVIVGGGIIGLCSAYFLDAKGYDVTVIDRSDLTNNCSYGNMGMITPSHFVPLAAPGIVAQGIRWMFNKKSPFYVKPAINPDLIRWGLHFIRKSTSKHVNQSALPLKELNVMSRSIYEEWATLPEFDFHYMRKGIIMYFNSEKTGEEEIWLAEKAKELGLETMVLNNQQLRTLEPQMKPNAMGGVHYLCDGHLDPNLLMQQLINILTERGVRLVRNTEATGFHAHNGKVTSVVAGQKIYDADCVLLAGGSWLPAIAGKLGVKIPLVPGKGYSFNVKNPKVNLNFPTILCEARVALTPMQGRLRIGGTMEIGRMDDKILPYRIAGIIESLPSYFDNLRVDTPAGEEIWFGYRPCSADGLPYIGPSRKYPNLYIAGGHSMMGLSMGPATGKLISEMIDGEKTTIPVNAYNPERFK